MCKKSGEYVTLNEQCIHSILFGGDQLTAARARGSQLIRRNSEIPSERLEGLHPVAEDWHTKVTVLKVHIIQITQSQLSRTCMYPFQVIWFISPFCLESLVQ